MHMTASNVCKRFVLSSHHLVCVLISQISAGTGEVSQAYWTGLMIAETCFWIAAHHFAQPGLPHPMASAWLMPACSLSSLLWSQSKVRISLIYPPELSLGMMRDGSSARWSKHEYVMPASSGISELIKQSYSAVRLFFCCLHATSAFESSKCV